MNNQNAIERLRASATASRTEISLRKRVLAAQSAKGKILLLDISSSMDKCDNENSSRIDKLWNIVQQLRAEGLNFRIATFNHNVEWSDATSQPIPYGGTDLTAALDFVHAYTQAHPGTISSITVVHDGEPFDPDSAIQSALALALPVNVMFVGDAADHESVTFAQSLAKRTHGRFAQFDINANVQLALEAENATRLMLSDGSDTGRSIAL